MSLNFILKLACSKILEDFDSSGQPASKQSRNFNSSQRASATKSDDGSSLDEKDSESPSNGGHSSEGHSDSSDGEKGVVNVGDESVVDNLIVPLFMKNPTERVQEALKPVDPTTAEMCDSERCVENLKKELSLKECKFSMGAKWMYFFCGEKENPFEPSEYLKEKLGYKRSEYLQEKLGYKRSEYIQEILGYKRNEIISLCLDIIANQLDWAFHEGLIQYFVYEFDLNHFCVHWPLDNLDPVFSINDAARKDTITLEPSTFQEFDFKNFFKFGKLPSPMEDELLELCEIYDIKMKYGGYMILKKVKHHVNHEICSKFCVLKPHKTSSNALPYYNSFKKLSTDVNSSYEKYKDELPECAYLAYLLLQEMDDHLAKSCSAAVCLHCKSCKDHPDYRNTVKNVTHLVNVFKENFSKRPRVTDPEPVGSDMSDTSALKEQQNAWTCFQCNQQFSVSENLQKHLNQHEEENLAENCSEAKKCKRK